MTLVLALLHPDGVLHVSDRLVTVKAGGRMESYDPLANKSVVFVASDGIVAIGYSGLAYLEQVPTDQWIAYTLLAKPVCPDLVAEMVENPAPPSPDLGMALTRLAQRFERARERLSVTERQDVPELLIAGWQGRHSRRVSVRLWYDASVGHYQLRHLLPRQIDGRQAYVFGLPEQRLREDHRTAMLEKLPGAGSPEHAAAMMVGTLRGIAGGDPTVGAHAMVITLFHPSHRRIRTVFEPAAVTEAAFEGRDQVTRMPVAYGPWLVQAGHVVPPQVIAGRVASRSFGTFTVDLRAPPAPRDSDIIAYWGTQPRRPPP